MPRSSTRTTSDHAPAPQDDVGTVAMALGSGLIIQTVIDSTAVAPDLFARTMTRLLPDPR
jgi:hypothetical protein